MKRTYDEADITRWETAYVCAIPGRLQRISDGDLRRGRTLTTLSREYEYAGLIALARHNYDEAAAHFAAAADAWGDILQRYLNGQDIDPGLLNRADHGPFLLAHSSRDTAVVTRLVSLYAAAFPDAATDSNSTQYLGELARLLSKRERKRALDLLLTPPKDDGSEECVRAFHSIAAGKRDDFFSSLRNFVADWQERIADEHLQRFPDAVGCHYCLGWLGLAEWVWNERLSVGLPGIPTLPFRAR